MVKKFSFTSLVIYTLTHVNVLTHIIIHTQAHTVHIHTHTQHTHTHTHTKSTFGGTNNH